MAFPPLDRLKSQLLTSGLQERNNPLYQVINQLIDALRQTINATNVFLTGSIGGGGSGGILGATYITEQDETATLPNSLQITAGDNVTITVSGTQLIISATAQDVVVNQGTQLAVKQVEIEIPPNRRNGKLIVRDTFTNAQVGAPVIVCQAPDKESDMVFVQFIAEVINTRQMRVFWMAPFGAPRKMKINYLIGA